MPHAARSRRVSFVAVICRVAVTAAIGIALTPQLTMAQAGRVSYSAGGTHQCSGQRVCVVSGSFFKDCIDAIESLRARDCCPSSRSGTSGGFTLNYCIAGN